ncbi:hypothetical protein [Actinoplanes sp. NPDC026670]|uniref:hypothetical protein n=1 Tax=Actinoplanes sp. NPDC026670 TaxID=3154700 RepID=UPI003403E514
MPSDPGFEDGRCVSAVDWLGQRFTEGEKVLYCVFSSGRATTALGVVERIQAEQCTGWTYREAGEGDVVSHEANGKSWTKDTYTYWQVGVMVRTLKTAEDGDVAKPRNSWINAFNVTALPVEDVL